MVPLDRSPTGKSETRTTVFPIKYHTGPVG